jgi:hypothetical protein
MNGYAYREEDFLPDSSESKTDESNNLPATAGTFSLRRSHYFNETRALVGVVLSQTGVVIPFENASHKHQRSIDCAPYQHRRA